MARAGAEDYVYPVKVRDLMVSISIIALSGCGNPPPAAGPDGAVDAFAEARGRMVQDQLIGDRRGITNARVLSVMGKVPRHELVPVEFRHRAYEDGPLPIGYGQTISQPYVVAFMTAHLQTKPSDRLLEIGTGSGYQAAVLAQLVAHVFTMEMIGSLAERAGAELENLEFRNVSVRHDDGHQGWPDAAPFDGIIVTCAPVRIPQPLVEQLRDGGRMIIPVGPIGEQRLVLLHKTQNRIEETAVLPVRFVPMVGGGGH